MRSVKTIIPICLALWSVACGQVQPYVPRTTPYTRTFLRQTNAAAARAWLDINSVTDGYSPTKFGAVGDGVNDDTVPVQDCIDACISDGMPMSILPGTYKLTDTLQIGDGLADVWRFEMTGYGDACLLWAGADPCNIIEATGLYQAVFRGLYIDGDNLVDCNGIYLTGPVAAPTQHVIFEQCSIWDCDSIGLHIVQQSGPPTDYVQLINCSLAGNGVNLKIEGSARQIHAIGGANIEADTYGVLIDEGVFHGTDLFFGINGTCDVYLNDAISSIRLDGCSSESKRILDTNDPNGGNTILLPPNAILGMNHTRHLPDFNWVDVNDAIDYNLPRPLFLESCNFIGDVNLGANAWSCTSINTLFYNGERTPDFVGNTEEGLRIWGGHIRNAKYIQVKDSGNYVMLLQSTTPGVVVGLGDDTTTDTEAMVRIADHLQFRTDGLDRLLIQGGTGNISMGHGVWPPRARLDVNGGIISDEESGVAGYLRLEDTTGAHHTILTGSTTAIDVNVLAPQIPFDHFTFTIQDDGDWDGEVIPVWQAPIDYGVKILSVRSTVMGSSTPTLTFNIEERAWASLGSAGTDIFTADETADGDGTNHTSINNEDIAAAAHLVFTTGTSAESGTVNNITVTVYYRKDW